MKITRLIFTTTGPYEDMPYRPYVSPQAYHKQKKAFAMKTADGTRLDAETLAEVANVYLRPGFVARQPVLIPGGWDARRLRFMMVVDLGVVGSGRFTQILSGYSYHLGLSDSGNLDPDMRLEFNDSVLIHEFHGETTVVEAAQILSGHSNGHKDIRSAYHTVRPQDLFNQMDIEELLGSDVDHVIDVRSTFLSQKLKKSSRRNNIPSVYLSWLAETFQDAVSIAEERGEEDSWEKRFFQTASSMAIVNEPQLHRDKFLGLAMANSDLGQVGSITFGDLLKLPVEFDDNALNVFSSTKEAQVESSTYLPGSWTDSGYSTNAAVLLGNMVPTTMLENQLSSVSFRATNITPDYTYDIALTSCHSLYSTGLAAVENIERFKRQMRSIVLPHLKFFKGNKRGAEIDATFNAFGESQVAVRARGTRWYSFRIPTFADARFAPTMAADVSSLEKLAQHLAPVLKEITGVTE